MPAPSKEIQYPLYRRLDRLQVKKILLPLVLESQAAQTVVSHYTDYVLLAATCN
jgi:hypothetical protein